MRTDASTNELRAALGDLAIPEAELEELVRASRKRHPPAVRINALGYGGAGNRAMDIGQHVASGGQVPWYPHPALWTGPNDRPTKHPFYGAGDFYVQDAGSLLAVSLLDPRPGEVICDLCAAPGGKATAILEAIGERGWVVVNEPIRSRVGPLLLNLWRHGSTRWSLWREDPAALAETLSGRFDAVLVDAPCTAQTRAWDDAAAERPYSVRAIGHAAARQRRILAAAVRLVRPGGRLVYSTCTFSWAENEARVTDLLERGADLAPDPLPMLERYRTRPPAPEACYRLWPHRDGCAGAFAARLRLRADADRETVHPSGREKRTGGRTPHVPWSDWGRWTHDAKLRPDSAGRRVFAWPHDVPRALAPTRAVGPEVAFAKGRTWFPSYGLAMRRDGTFEASGKVKLSDDDTRLYLRGEPVPATARGWVVVTYGERALGWGKGDGRMIKNHLPRSARLR